MGKVGLSGKYQTYPEYKDSGVEWIGEIPTDWDMWKITHACPYVASGTTPKTDGGNYYDGTNLWVTTGELREGVILDTTKKVTDKALYDLPTLRIHPKGSVVIAMYGATIGRLGILGNNATTNQACCVMPPSDIINNKYLFYWLYSTRQEIINLSSGGGQPNVNQEKISSLKVSAPTYKYQVEIANFLDYETAKIATLIEKQQQLIKLLKEKRQAVISHAVTKGINPNAPMRDSGVEWLGEVPEHWDIVPIKHISKIRYGIGEPPKYQEEGIPLIRATNIRSGKISEVGLVLVNPDHIPENRIVWLDKGDIIVVRSGAGTGDSSIISHFYEGSIAGFDMVVRPIKCLPEFLGYALLSNYIRNNQIDLEKTRAAQPHLNAEELGECFALMPTNQEQRLIVTHIERKILKLDVLIVKAEKVITLMQERRTALISAAVTGKIDVRDWVAPESSSNTMESCLRGNDAELNAAVDLNTEADLSKEAGL
ncbi:restriction endonuclease subunit S [Thalassolituus oleivorans]|uniref:restriction endonuclease subunit S n=1 Tax=Thalassolituus oleivorans TaxID=187493 RepID=UPI0024099CE5|nr:restriction endonuclease subunit S [Thalassolituus oleivorans]MDF1641799.1 restriction endonuclease subunit S [Thalassolituus oleivorans]